MGHNNLQHYLSGTYPEQFRNMDRLGDPHEDNFSHQNRHGTGGTHTHSQRVETDLDPWITSPRDVFNLLRCKDLQTDFAPSLPLKWIL